MPSSNIFSVPVFFILFRETLEAAVIISVLLSFLHKAFPDNPKLSRKLGRQVWVGALLGLGLSVGIGAAFIAIWYTVASNLWESAEAIWEGVFSLFATLLITVMAIAMLKTNNMQEKWKRKLTEAMNMHLDKVNEWDDTNGDASQKFGSLASWRNVKTKMGRKYTLFVLPFITVLREGLEAMVFMGGVSLGEPGTAIPLAAICGIICAIAVGYILYRGGNIMNLHYFFVASTCFLLLIAAGLFSKAIGNFEDHAWQNIIGGEDSGVIDYNVLTAIWHVTCCDQENPSNGGWVIFSAIFGWRNTATIGTIVGYIAYWIAVSAILVGLRVRDWMRPDEATKIEEGVASPETIGNTKEEVNIEMN